MSVGQELRRRLAGWFWFSVSHANETLARLSVIIRHDLLWKICSQGGLLVWMANWCWPNGNPLQYSCSENPMDRGTLRAPVHGATGVRHDWATFTTIGRRAQSLATLDVSVRLLEYLTACAGFPARKWQNREKAPSPMTKPQKTHSVIILTLWWSLSQPCSACKGTVTEHDSSLLVLREPSWRLPTLTWI